MCNRTVCCSRSEAVGTKEPNGCVCLCSVWLTELQLLSLWVNLYKTPEEWKHSEIITLSLHINSRLKEYESLCLCVREIRGRKIFEGISNKVVWFLPPVLFPPPSHFFDVTAYLRSINQVWKRRRGFVLLQGSNSNNSISLKFSFNPKEPFSMKDTQEHETQRNAICIWCLMSASCVTSKGKY